MLCEHRETARAGARCSESTLIWLDLSTPACDFLPLPGGTEDRPANPASVLSWGPAPNSLAPLTSSRRGPGAPVAPDFVTTVDQSDIRGLVTDMSLIRQGLPPLYGPASAASCGRPKGAPRIPPDRTAVATGPPGPSISPHPETCKWAHDASSTSSRPIAQMKPASSRATAVTASAGCLPRPTGCPCDVKPLLCLPCDGAHPRRDPDAPLPQRLAHPRLAPVVPRRLHQQPPHVGVARLGDRPAAAGRAAGLLRREQPHVAHEVAGRREPPQVPHLRRHRHRRHELHPAAPAGP